MPEIAKDILHYGLEHAFVYGTNPYRTLLVRPWLPAFLAIAAHEPGWLLLPPLAGSEADFIADMTVGSTALSLWEPGAENAVFGWMQMRIADDGNTPLALQAAIAVYRARFHAAYPQGMADALRNWGGTWPSHPLTRAFEGLQ